MPCEMRPSLNHLMYCVLPKCVCISYWLHFLRSFLCFYYWYFVSAWIQIGSLRWKWIPVFVLQVLVVVLLGWINDVYWNWDCTVLRHGLCCHVPCRWVPTSCEVGLNFVFAVHWWWKKHVSLKCVYPSTRLYSVTTGKSVKGICCEIPKNLV